MHLREACKHLLEEGIHHFWDPSTGIIANRSTQDIMKDEPRCTAPEGPIVIGGLG